MKSKLLTLFTVCDETSTGQITNYVQILHVLREELKHIMHLQLICSEYF